MKLKENNRQSGQVTTEGDDLYYEVRGQGQPLLMIAGGGGDGNMYSLVADILSDEYKVITYDRRANSRSTMNNPQNFEISQQSRDAVAVLHAAGEDSAFVFGNSSGAVIALEMAKSQSEAVRTVIVHEPPLTRLHPRSKKWQRFFAGVYWLGCWFGSSVASLRFVFGVGLPIAELIRSPNSAELRRQKVGKPSKKSESESEFFVKRELLPVTNYLPDLEMIKKNGIRVVMAAGEKSLAKKRFYAETAPILAEKLGCEMVIFPGHHVSYIDMPEEWAATLRNILGQAPKVPQ